MLIMYLFKGVAELLTLYMLLQLLFHAECQSRSKKITFSIIYCIVTILQVLFTYQVLLNAATSFIMKVVASFAYATSWYNRLFASVFTISIGICSEGIVMLLLEYGLSLSVSTLTSDAFLFPIIVLLSACVQVIITMLITKIIDFYRKNAPRIYTTIILIVCSLGLFSIILFVTFADTQYMPAAIVAILLILFCAAMCGGLLRDQLRVQQERLRLEFLEQQSTDQIEHYTALYQHSRDIHKLRHDMKNFVLSADSLLQQEQYDALHKHFGSFLDSVQPPTLTDTGNPLLDAVLSAKRADAPDTPFHLQIPALSYAHIDPMDIAMLLATALDNAIAGCKGEQSPYILVRITQHEQMLSLYVENPTHQPIMTKKNRLISQKANPERHGYGMQGMERIAQKYHGSLGWKCENGVFELRVLVQDLPSAKVSVQSSNL